MQHLVHKSLQMKQGCLHTNKAWCDGTIDVVVWRDAYNFLDGPRFLEGD